MRFFLFFFSDFTTISPLPCMHTVLGATYDIRTEAESTW